MEVPTKSFKPKEVAEALGCTTDHVYLLIKRGQLKAFRVGGKVNLRITDYDLRDFIQREEVGAEEVKDGSH